MVETVEFNYFKQVEKADMVAFNFSSFSAISAIFNILPLPPRHTPTISKKLRWLICALLGFGSALTWLKMVGPGALGE